MLRLVRKQPTCPSCGIVVADATYRPWPGNLTLTATDGSEILPSRGALPHRRAEQAVSAAAAADIEQAQARLEFVTQHIIELIYEIHCSCGHAILRTAPQLTRAMRHTRGRWVSLG